MNDYVNCCEHRNICKACYKKANNGKSPDRFDFSVLDPSGNFDGCLSQIAQS